MARSDDGDAVLRRIDQPVKATSDKVCLGVAWVGGWFVRCLQLVRY